MQTAMRGDGTSPKHTMPAIGFIDVDSQHGELRYSGRSVSGRLC